VLISTGVGYARPESDAGRERAIRREAGIPRSEIHELMHQSRPRPATTQRHLGDNEHAAQPAASPAIPRAPLSSAITDRCGSPATPAPGRAMLVSSDGPPVTAIIHQSGVTVCRSPNVSPR
jgi:hypothetical protein